PARPRAPLTSGCEDFAGFPEGNIGVIQRGTCTFAVKAANAQAANAGAVVIFNEGEPGRTDVVEGTLGGPVVTIPVVAASFETGVEFNSTPGLVLRWSRPDLRDPHPVERSRSPAVAARTTWWLSAPTSTRSASPRARRGSTGSRGRATSSPSSSTRPDEARRPGGRSHSTGSACLPSPPAGNALRRVQRRQPR